MRRSLIWLIDNVRPFIIFFQSPGNEIDYESYNQGKASEYDNRKPVTIGRSIQKLRIEIMIALTVKIGNSGLIDRK